VIVPEIEDVDVAGGLKRVAGNKKLYRNLLQPVRRQTGRRRPPNLRGVEEQ
jgi:hypothetical protein